MSLDYSLEGIKDWQTICRTDEGTTTPVTANLIIGMMGIGMGSITDANVDEVGWRFDLYQRMFGPLLVESTGEDFIPRPINADDVRQHIGLHTNVALETRAKWLKRITESDFNDFVRNNRVKESA